MKIETITDHTHRALNTGADPFEEEVTFYRNHPGEDPQPLAGGEQRSVGRHV
ncbi:MAG: hypothetical protein PVH91_10645 [Pseudomonadales bacterium]|jgi:hypothetical protein